jgi:hypothetical protein
VWLLGHVTAASWVGVRDRQGADCPAPGRLSSSDCSLRKATRIPASAEMARAPGDAVPAVRLGQSYVWHSSSGSPRSVGRSRISATTGVRVVEGSVPVWSFQAYGPRSPLSTGPPEQQCQDPEDGHVASLADQEVQARIRQEAQVGLGRECEDQPGPRDDRELVSRAADG